MKATRKEFIEKFYIINSMVLTGLEADTLATTVNNLMALEKVNSEMNAMREDLKKRLYKDTEEGRYKAFEEVLYKYETEKDSDKKFHYENLLKDSYSELWPIYQKQLSVIKTLYDKEVDVDITKVSKDKFIQGILRENKLPFDAVSRTFSYMFDETKTETSELDELLK